jgi:hypothetical protein
MKRILIATTAFFLFISATAFAGTGEEKINKEVLSKFHNEFKGATNVKWYAGAEISKVDFVMNNFHVEAYFTNEGELLGSARNVLYEHLPMSALKAITGRFDEAPVYDIIEYSLVGETFYHLTVETASKKMQVKITPSGDVTVLKKTKK